MSIYSAAPIVEAVLRIDFSNRLNDLKYKKYVRRMKKEYDHHVAVLNREATIDLQNGATIIEDKDISERYTSGDQTDIMVVQPKFLSWSRLAPYLGWDSFATRFDRDLDLFTTIFGHTKVDRIGVRYINRIDVPSENDMFRFEDYLTINIGIPTEWEVIQNYGWRFERLFPESGLRAIVQSAIMPAELPGCGAVLLDVDVATSGEIFSKLGDMKNTMVALRELKNKIFETAITDKARIRFQNK